MPPENIEVVRRAFQAYAEADLDSLLPLLDPGVEVRSLLTEPEGTTFHGHDGVRKWLATVHEIFPDWSPMLQRAEDFDGAVVAAFHVTATGAGSGVPIDEGFWYAARFEGGKIASFGFFRTEEDAREALGLSG
jgi:ketosteroid isomerase-like protein